MMIKRTPYKISHPQPHLYLQFNLPTHPLQNTVLFQCDQLQLCGSACVLFPQDEPAHAFLPVLHSKDGQCHL